MRQTGLLVIVAGSLFAAMPALAQGGGSYGNSGFTIADGSGDNRLTIGGTAQFTYNASFRDEDSVGSTADMSVGFENPITRIRASGTIGSRQLGYRLQLTSLNDGSIGFDDAYASYDYGDGWSVVMGQFNLPVVREVSVGAEGHLGSDFSISSMYFGQGYSQGLMARYRNEQMGFAAAFSDGANSANTGFTDAGEADFALSARVEGLLMGSDWGRFDNYTSFRGSGDEGFLLGGAVHYQSGGETNGTTDVDVLLLTADGQYEGPGYNITGVVYYRNVDLPAGDASDYGFLLQGGYFFSDALEGFARMESIFLDEPPAGDDTATFLFGGVNYYVFPESNAAKFTAQIGYSFNDTVGLTSSGGTLNNAFLGQGTDGEVAFQGFFGLVF